MRDRGPGRRHSVDRGCRFGGDHRRTVERDGAARAGMSESHEARKSEGALACRFGNAGGPELTAREAISHLIYNGLALRFHLPGEPSEEIRKMVEPYLLDDEMGETLANLATKYVMKRLADDHLRMSWIEIPEETVCKTRAPEDRLP